MIETGHLAPPAATVRLRRAAIPQRSTRTAVATLALTVAVVYIAAALTLPRGYGGLAAAEAAIGAVELAWAAALQLRRHSRPVLACGAVLQLLLVVFWIVSRTAGLPGQGVLPVGELDVLCVLDELLAATIALRLGSRLRPLSPGRALALIQVAVVLAGVTLYAWGGGHGHGASASAGAPGSRAGEQLHFFCRLL